jgi:hypothetical protein
MAWWSSMLGLRQSSGLSGEGAGTGDGARAQHSDGSVGAKIGQPFGVVLNHGEGLSRFGAAARVYKGCFTEAGGIGCPPRLIEAGGLCCPPRLILKTAIGNSPSGFASPSLSPWGRNFPVPVPTKACRGRSLPIPEPKRGNIPDRVPSPLYKDL